jgi:hypothetical protein
MVAVAFMAPIIPGKKQEDKDFVQEVTGPRRAEYEESRRRLGVTREAVWHQQTPQGTVAIIYLEAEDPQRVFQGLGSSSAPFDQWFRERVEEINGLDLSQPPPGPPPEQLMDERF